MLIPLRIFKRSLQSFLLVAVLLLVTVAQAVPSLQELQQTVQNILQTAPQGNVVGINEENTINLLIENRDPNKELPDKAYALAVSYMHEDRWQEAIWILKRSGLLSYGISLEKTLAEALSKNALTVGNKIGKGVSGSAVGTLQLSAQRTIKVVVKPRDGGFQGSSESEVWAYDLDEILFLNIVPIAVARNVNGADQTIHLMVPDAQDSGLNFRDSGYQPAYPDIYFLDYLIGNVDRHYQNSMFSKAKRLFAIDHGRGLYLPKASYGKRGIHVMPYQANFVPTALVLQRLRSMTLEQFTSLLPKNMSETTVQYLTTKFRDAQVALAPIQIRPLTLYIEDQDGKNLHALVDFGQINKEILEQNKVLEAERQKQEQEKQKLEQERLQQAQLQAAQQAEEQRRLHEQQLQQKQQEYANDIHHLLPGLLALDAQNKEYVKRNGMNLTENGHRFMQLILLADEVKPAHRDSDLLNQLVLAYNDSKLGYRDFRRLYAELLEREISPEFIANTRLFFNTVAPLHVFFTDEEFKQKYQDPKHMTPVFMEHYKQVAVVLPPVMSCRFVYW